jgi:hypothetical protein
VQTGPSSKHWKHPPSFKVITELLKQPSQRPAGSQVPWKVVVISWTSTVDPSQSVIVSESPVSVIAVSMIQDEEEGVTQGSEASNEREKSSDPSNSRGQSSFGTIQSMKVAFPSIVKEGPSVSVQTKILMSADPPPGQAIV